MSGIGGFGKSLLLLGLGAAGYHQVSSLQLQDSRVKGLYMLLFNKAPEKSHQEVQEDVFKKLETLISEKTSPLPPPKETVTKEEVESVVKKALDKKNQPKATATWGPLLAVGGSVGAIASFLFCGPGPYLGVSAAIATLGAMETGISQLNKPKKTE